MTESSWAHIETSAQMVAGCILAQVVLWGFGVSLKDAIAINVVMFFVSYARTYVIRRVFGFVRART
jgi:hypothetical protein